MAKRFLDTQTGHEVEIVDPKDFVFIKSPQGVKVIGRDRLDEIKGDIRAREKATGVEYEGHTLQKGGDVLNYGFGRMVPVRPDRHEYVVTAPEPEADPSEPPKAP